MEIEIGHDWGYGTTARVDVPRDVPSGVSGFLAWLMIWLRVCAGQSWLQSRAKPIQASPRGW